MKTDTGTNHIFDLLTLHMPALWVAGAAVLGVVTLAHTGLAWLDPRYGADRGGLREDQALAQSEGAGLWAQPNPMSPWEWRRLGKGVETKKSNRRDAEDAELAMGFLTSLKRAASGFSRDLFWGPTKWLYSSWRV